MSTTLGALQPQLFVFYSFPGDVKVREGKRVAGPVAVLLTMLLPVILSLVE
jgi:hypothetical protein